MGTAEHDGTSGRWSELACAPPAKPDAYLRAWDKIRRAWGHRWFVVIPLLAALFVLGLWGFYRQHPEHHALAWWETFRLFHWHPHIDEAHVGWQLQITRFAAPLLFAFALGDVLRPVWIEAWQRVRVRRWRGHAIVCGLGPKNLHLVEGLRRRGTRVVVVEQDSEHRLVPSAQDLGAILLFGDATQPDVLVRAGATRAGVIVASCDADGTNAAIAAAAIALAASAKERHSSLCIAHVVNTELRAQLDGLRRARLPEGSPRFRLRFFSMHENAARLLYTDHLGPTLARRTADRTDPPWVFIVGFGDTGEAVARRLLVSPCCRQPTPTRLTVVDEKARERVESFLRRNPAVEPNQLGRVEAVTEHLEDGRELAEIIRGHYGEEAGAAPDAVVLFSGTSGRA